MISTITQKPKAKALVILLVITIITAILPVVKASEGFITVSPDMGPGGQTITITGTAFLANGYVNLSYYNQYLSPAAWVTVENYVSCDALGAFQRTLNVVDFKQVLPGTPDPDLVTFMAMENGTGRNATAQYSEYRRRLLQVGTLTGTIGNATVTGLNVKMFQSLIVAGNYFHPGSISLSWDGTSVLATTTANQTGYFSTTITVPVTPIGPHNIVVTDANLNFIVTVNVNTTLVLTPSQGNVGDPVTVEGYGYPASLPTTAINVTVWWGTAMLGWGLVDTTGYFSTTIIVPRVVGGIHQVMGQANDTVPVKKRTSANATFAVNPQLRVTPSSGLVNTVVTASGSGFRATLGASQVNVTVYWDDPNVLLGYSLTDSSGAFTVTFVVPNTWSGVHKVLGNETTPPFVTATATFTILSIPDPPVADAGPDQVVYVNERIVFDGAESRSAPGATIQRYQWDFQNDGVFDAEGELAFYSYPGEGTYTVLLKVTDTFDQTDTDTCVITVRNKPPFASFTYSPLKPTIVDTVSFFDTTSDEDGTVVSWRWDFGDGVTTTIQNPSHNYTDKGMYVVTLTVTDDDGAMNATTMNLTIVNIAPSANFTYTPTSLKVGEDVQFSDRSTDPEERSLSYGWDFGDNDTSTQQNPIHRFSTSGTKEVRLTVTDDEGESDSISKVLIVKENVPPVAGFNLPESSLVDTEVKFLDTTTDPDGIIVSWFWDFGDESNSSEQNPAHRYETAGTYVVTLTVEDDSKAVDVISQSIEIIPVYDLRIEVRDILGFAIPNTRVELWSNGALVVSGFADDEGRITLVEIAQGNYVIHAKHLGQTTVLSLALVEYETVKLQVVLSTYSIPIIGGAFLAVALIVIYAFKGWKRRRERQLVLSKLRR